MNAANLIDRRTQHYREEDADVDQQQDVANHPGDRQQPQDCQGEENLRAVARSGRSCGLAIAGHDSAMNHSNCVRDLKGSKSAGKNVSYRTMLFADYFRLIGVHQHPLKLVLVIHP